MDAREQFEEQLVRKLTEGEIAQEDTEEVARKRLPMKSEIRIQAQVDPVQEETKQFRKMAEEIDGRYDKYS